MHQLLSSQFQPHSVNLDSTGRLHLLPQVVLVFSDRAVPSTDRLVLTYHDVLGDLIEQSERTLVALWKMGRLTSLPEIVRNNHNTTGECVDSISQAVNRRDIQTVGGFVQQEHVRPIDS
jgi:hypothetical protein